LRRQDLNLLRLPFRHARTERGISPKQSKVNQEIILSSLVIKNEPATQKVVTTAHHFEALDKANMVGLRVIDGEASLLAYSYSRAQYDARAFFDEGGALPIEVLTALLQAYAASPKTAEGN
jgi:hypothetical protein